MAVFIAIEYTFKVDPFQFVMVLGRAYGGLPWLRAEPMEISYEYRRSSWRFALDMWVQAPQAKPELPKLPNQGPAFRSRSILWHHPRCVRLTPNEAPGDIFF